LVQENFNVLGNVSSSYDSIVSLTYTLNGGPEIPLTVAWQPYGFRRLIARGDFNLLPSSLRMLINHINYISKITFLLNLTSSLVSQAKDTGRMMKNVVNLDNCFFSDELRTRNNDSKVKSIS